MTEVTPPNHPAQKKVSRNDPAQVQEKSCWPKFRKKHVDPLEGGKPPGDGVRGDPLFSVEASRP